MFIFCTTSHQTPRNFGDRKMHQSRIMINKKLSFKKKIERAFELAQRTCKELSLIFFKLYLSTLSSSNSYSYDSTFYFRFMYLFITPVLFHKVMAHFHLKFKFYFSLNLKSNSNNFLFFFKRVQFFSYSNLYIWLRGDTYLNLKSNHYLEILRNQKLGSYIYIRTILRCCCLFF